MSEIKVSNFLRLSYATTDLTDKIIYLGNSLFEQYERCGYPNIKKLRDKHFKIMEIKIEKILTHEYIHLIIYKITEDLKIAMEKLHNIDKTVEGLK